MNVLKSLLKTFLLFVLAVPSFADMVTMVAYFGGPTFNCGEIGPIDSPLNLAGSIGCPGGQGTAIYYDTPIGLGANVTDFYGGTIASNTYSTGVTKVSGVPLGQSYAISYLFQYSGTLLSTVPYNPNGFQPIVRLSGAIGFAPIGQPACGFAQDQILRDAEDFYAPTPGATTIELVVQSQTCITKATTANLTTEFGIDFRGGFQNGSGFIQANFLNTAKITDILITDPTTGAMLPGVSVTSADGSAFPVNVSTVPEPYTIQTVFCAFLVLLCVLNSLGNKDRLEA